MAKHVVATLVSAFLLASMTVWVLPNYASPHMLLMARSPNHLSGKSVEEMVRELREMRETVSRVEKQVSIVEKENMELKKHHDLMHEKLDAQEDELDALVRAAKASIPPRNVSSSSSSLRTVGRRLNGQGTPVIYSIAEFFADGSHSITDDRFSSLQGYAQNNFWSSTMAALVGDTTNRAHDIVVTGTTGVSPVETALVSLGMGLGAPFIAMVNPALGTFATFAYTMFNIGRTTGNLASQVNYALETLYNKITDETRAYTDAAISLEMLNAKQDANREAIAAVMDEMLWVPDMLHQAAEQEDSEQRQTRVMYQLVLQHDLAKLSAAVFGPCIYDTASADCKSWEEQGTFIQAIVFATIHLQVLNDIAVTDTRYMSVIAARLKEVAARYYHLLTHSLETMDQHVKCLVGGSDACGFTRGASVDGLPGTWFLAPRDDMSCNDVCHEIPNMEFDAASQQQTRGQAADHFNPGAELVSTDRNPAFFGGCSGIEFVACSHCRNNPTANYGADGSNPDGNCNIGANFRPVCACKFSLTSDPQLLTKFGPLVAGFLIDKCVAPPDGVIFNAQEPSCAEGAIFDTTDGSATCTARCKPGFRPSVESVPCTSGWPQQLFSCVPELTYTKFGQGPCRGTSPTHNPSWRDDWYTVWDLTSNPADTAASFAECKARCDFEPTCIAIEVKQDGASNRCELWRKEPLATSGNNYVSYECHKKDVLTPHFPAATAGPSEARCAAQDGTPATQEGCDFACSNQKVAGATHYSVGSWSHSPGCFVVVEGTYKGSCHWNTNTGNIGYDNKVRPVCTKPADRTFASCVDTSNGATAKGDYWGMEQGCQSYTDDPTWCAGSHYYNDEDFSPDEMCCACGGGLNPDFENPAVR